MGEISMSGSRRAASFGWRLLYADRESAENTEGIGREARGIQIGESAERASEDINFSVNSARGI